MNEKKKRQNQFVALDVDCVAPRHTMVYVWETLGWVEEGGYTESRCTPNK